MESYSRPVATAADFTLNGSFGVESASSYFSGADAQIGSADYLFIKSPLTGVAEKQAFLDCVRIVDRKGQARAPCDSVVTLLSDGALLRWS